jgi:hypothetical protein
LSLSCLDKEVTWILVAILVVNFSKVKEGRKEGREGGREGEREERKKGGKEGRKEGKKKKEKKKRKEKKPQYLMELTIQASPGCRRLCAMPGLC